MDGRLLLRSGTERKTWTVPFYARSYWKTSTDGERVAVVSPSDDWTTVAVDLSVYAGDVVFVRFVYVGVARFEDVMSAESWSIRGVSVETRLPRTPQSPLQPRH